MTNVVTLRPESLDDLAQQINQTISHMKDGVLETAILLGRARAQCKSEGITFTSWVAGNIDLSYDRCRTLANIGVAENPAKALADLREFNRKNVAKYAVTRTKKPTPGTPIVVPYEGDDDEDDPEDIPYDQMSDSMRIRGFMHRAAEARNMAEADNMAGIEPTDALRNAARKAAEAWIKALANLEGD